MLFCVLSCVHVCMHLQGAVVLVRVLVLLTPLGAGRRGHEGAVEGRQPGVRRSQRPHSVCVQPGADIHTSFGGGGGRVVGVDGFQVLLLCS